MLVQCFCGSQVSQLCRHKASCVLACHIHAHIIPMNCAKQDVTLNRNYEFLVQVCLQNLPVGLCIHKASGVEVTVLSLTAHPFLSPSPPPPLTATTITSIRFLWGPRRRSSFTGIRSQTFPIAISVVLSYARGY